MKKYRTAGRLVTSLQVRQRHWQFASQFLFPPLHEQQPRPLFRAQAPLHGQETSTDWSYLTRTANFKKKMVYEWKRGGSTFSLKFNRIPFSRKFYKTHFKKNCFEVFISPKTCDKPSNNLWSLERLDRSIVPAVVYVTSRRSVRL